MENASKPLSPFLSGLLGAAAFFVLLFGALYAFPSFRQGVTRILTDPTGIQTNTFLSPIESVVEKTNPAVVSIIITKEVPVIERYYREQQLNPFSPFFFSVPQYRQNGTEKKEIGGGSGFIVSTDGYIVTNRHVVNEDGAEYTVFTNEGKTFNAKIVATDEALDIAVLKIDVADPLPFLEFGDSSTLKLGQTVVAIGNALGEFRNTVSIGVVSGLSRSITAGDASGRSEQLTGVIQTDAAINPGNSGGPLLDLSGKVIGVNVAVAGGAENIGFALPANEVSKVVASIRTHGRVLRPYLGVRFLLITKELAETNKLPVDYGALVQRGEEEGQMAVVKGSPADKAGIKENDIILEMDGQRITEASSLQNLISARQVGDVVKLKILRDNKERELSVTLEERPESIQ